MTDAKFNVTLKKLAEYLAMEKKFVVNPLREPEFKQAMYNAFELFPDSKIWIEDDPLQMGAMILCIEGLDFSVTEINLFSAMIATADNFEIYPTDNENVRFAAVFQNVLVRI